MFIMLDGIDGCGKSTVLQTWKDYLTKQGNAIFDLKNYWQENNNWPDLAEIKSYDFIFSCEPTRVGIGQVIRQDLIKSGADYSPLAVAEAYSLDRLILYSKILIPLLRDNKCVIQDRGVSSSLAYQSLQSSELTFEKIANLSGNKLALENRPDWLVLMDLEPEKAIERLEARSDKRDDSLFEKLDFLKKLDARFRSPEFQKLFTDKGAEIRLLSAREKIDIMKEQAVNLLREILHI